MSTLFSCSAAPNRTHLCQSLCQGCHCGWRPKPSPGRNKHRVPTRMLLTASVTSGLKRCKRSNRFGLSCERTVIHDNTHAHLVARFDFPWRDHNVNSFCLMTGKPPPRSPHAQSIKARHDGLAGDCGHEGDLHSDHCCEQRRGVLGSLSIG